MGLIQSRRLQSVAGVLCSVAVNFGAWSQVPDQIYKRPAAIPFPATNPYSPEKAALGKALFFEPRLSGAQNQTCATCHNPSFGYQAPGKTAIGATNTALERRGRTILNVAWGQSFFWDGRAKTVEEQALGPIQAPAEMNLPIANAIARLKDIPAYRSNFDKIFPGEGITADTIGKAIATYERTLVSSYTPFDAWVAGDEKAISSSAKRGYELFNGKADCSKCHSGWNFTDDKFHDVGTTTSDIGRFKIASSSELNRYAFKTPTLRDATQRAPYMHNGEYPTLEATILHYMSGGIVRPSRSPLMRPLDLSEPEVADLVAFLKTLTGTKQNVVLPILPN